MRVVVLELQYKDSGIFDEIMEVINRHPDIEYLQIKDKPMLSLLRLEIYPDRWKINLTIKEYDLLSLLVANKGESSHMTRYIGKYGEKMPMIMKATLSDAIVIRGGAKRAVYNPVREGSGGLL